MQVQSSGLRPSEGLGDFMAFTADAQARRRLDGGWPIPGSGDEENDSPSDERGAPTWWPVLGDGGPTRS